ncbi:MAG UNVERIFIED_CONTAM: hypothetical protein LVQ98_02195 [Rickettsiaceae bacterium]|jgi:hypothetical protein
MIESIISKNYFGLLSQSNINNYLPEDYLEFMSKIHQNYTASRDISYMDRIVYDIDIYTPCMSPATYNDYPLSIEDLLLSLDQVANKVPSKVIIDKEIIAFTRSRIEKYELGISNVSNIEKFVDAPLMKGISVLALAQETCSKILKYPIYVV